ncbi:hypothetical protein QGN32_10775 [Mycolicibacterium sp. ND9-15]|uniref:hypothetical protein n=1 Tax=Mycolicibacterium sp. ND9-15 TaxID=3042320 RepID=UPI002DD8FBBE|nr:hypothetical protein [Mycolicibacterium sp. ND9-15]WSE58287.1 hypothetical protein QGN32_10775 [Mycolicibacterium sp. ND9-15]
MNRALSTAFGLVMVAAAALEASDRALVVCAFAVVMVLASNVFRPAATIAVVTATAALVLASAGPTLAALCGLSSTAYLVLRHTADISLPTVAGALGFTTVGLAAAMLPFELPWVPLIAPLAALAAVVLATRPFWQGGRRSGAPSTRV